MRVGSWLHRFASDGGTAARRGERAAPSARRVTVARRADAPASFGRYARAATVALCVLATWALLGACAPEAGTERAACYGNGTCNAGLACLSGRCVRLDADAAAPGDASPADDRAAPYYPADSSTPPWDGLIDLDSGPTADAPPSSLDASAPPDAVPSSPDASASRDAVADVVTDPGPMMCLGGHPLFDGGARWCDPGSCYCANPDRCFRREIITTWPTCCSVPVVCY